MSIFVPIVNAVPAEYFMFFFFIFPFIVFDFMFVVIVIPCRRRRYYKLRRSYKHM